jgi:hypothetical protein
MVEKGSPEVSTNVGDLFSNAMSQEQGNTKIVKRNNDFRTKVMKDIPS